MKVKKLVRHLKDNTNIIFFRENENKAFAQYDSIYLLRNYPMDFDAYMLMNYKIKNFIPGQFNKTDKNYLRIIVEDGDKE